MADLSAPQNLSAEIVEQYRSQGFVHIPKVLTAPEIQRYLSDARVLLDREHKVSWDDGEGNVMDWVADPETKSAVMRTLALHPRITGIAELLAGQQLRMFKSELLLKRSTGASPTPFHFDDFAFPIAGRAVTLTAWVALVDVPVERGCLTFVPGSHIWPEATESEATAESNPAAAELWDPFDVFPELVWRPRVAVPIRAGDCTFHHSRLVHAAGTNATATPRISLTSVYMDAAAVYQPSAGNGYQDEVVGVEPGAPLDTDRYPRVGLDVSV
ncbi:phytanoyl-CoA dioxygenase family protein [Nocardia uniformis]|uniref:Phytanoyl-CoA dioxygenase family protein n=1 Tax=Nocardia uniformis TaxID=53432 RepID=A0A849BX38_9NOCA|nr:phytanoyl-CoA dioxygenase family protein [Nocardia uniformis]NNH68860.1 phytanoyl-CoA dioxygenase family protein [Nocardia uniformis]